jgi:hypothetical protein
MEERPGAAASAELHSNGEDEGAHEDGGAGRRDGADHRRPDALAGRQDRRAR